MIVFRYVGINIGSPLRAEMLEEHWSFTCQCKRCLDPTELGTYASAIWCYNCVKGRKEGNVDNEDKQGLMLPKGPIPAAASMWSCIQCGYTMDKAQIVGLIDVGLRIIK